MKNKKITTVSFFWKYLKKYFMQITIVLLAVILSTYLSVRSPELMGEAITKIGIYAQSIATTGTGDKSAFYAVIQTILLFAGIAWIASFVQSIVMSIVSGKATDTMRLDLFKKLEKLPIKYFDSHSDGDTLSRFTSDLDNISNTLNQAIHEFMANIAALIVVGYMMFNSNSELSLVLMSLLPVAVIVAIVIIYQAQKHVNIQQKRIGELNGFADERFTGQKLVIANGLGKQMSEEFEVYNEKLFDSTYKGQLYSNLLFPTLQGISLLSVAIVIFYGAWMLLAGRLTMIEAPGLIFLFSRYAQMFYMPLTQIASQYTQMQLAITGAKRVAEILNETEEQEIGQVIDIKGISGDIVLENVDFGYDPAEPVLKDVSLKVEKGQMVALVGHTGSGKTTIMNLLNRFYEIETGSIKFDGKDIREISMPSLRNHVGIVLQDSVLFTGTLADNIRFGKPEATLEEVIAVAKKAHIHDYIIALENGYDTVVSDANSGMSVGEKQLMSIARTLLTDPDLLILDEATSNVDTVTEARIQEAMDEVIKGRISFVIAHRLKTILSADKIIVLQQGEIIEEGTHASLLNDDGTYAELYNNQFVFE